MIKDIRAPLRAFLLADTALSQAVGSKRVYPIVLPQGERQASIVYTRISAQGDHHTEGASGLMQTRLQVDAWAPSADGAAALAGLVKARLDGYRGPMVAPGPSGGTVDVQGVFFDSEREDYQPDIEMYRVSRDFLIWYEES